MWSSQDSSGGYQFCMGIIKGGDCKSKPTLCVAGGVWAASSWFRNTLWYPTYKPEQHYTPLTSLVFTHNPLHMHSLCFPLIFALYESLIRYCLHNGWVFFFFAIMLLEITGRKKNGRDRNGSKFWLWQFFILSSTAQAHLKIFIGHFFFTCMQCFLLNLVGFLSQYINKLVVKMKLSWPWLDIYEG